MNIAQLGEKTVCDCLNLKHLFPTLENRPLFVSREPYDSYKFWVLNEAGRKESVICTVREHNYRFLRLDCQQAWIRQVVLNACRLSYLHFYFMSWIDG